MYMGYFLLTGVLFLIGLAVSNTLKSKFQQYGQMPLGAGLSGKEVAERMLQENGIYDVKVISVEGELTDHYNPTNKTVNLSAEVYQGRSIAAAAVAAHECGHAVQHAKSYSMLQFRSALVPVVNVASTITNFILLGGLGFMFFAKSPVILLIAIVCFAATALFTLITLPVEYDASRRALAWMESTGLTYREEHDKAADALKWAARTYVVAAIGSIATLLYFIMMFMGRRD